MPETIALDLALQGGGAHGAFTWGVLDRLLDERRISIALRLVLAEIMRAGRKADKQQRC